MILGIGIPCLSILGDLCESFLKRCANVKDSGWLLQDHGGILDRVDSMLLNAPFVYWFAVNYMQYANDKNYNFDDVRIEMFFK
mmetsp:Transcript_33055/g.50688  ORF Transcript_33055/g.50688 Transcript_33055/m.50688 type:complete len:83 (+) Transcript_33055:1103-1351(+)